MTGSVEEELEILLERHQEAVVRGDAAEAEWLAVEFLAAVSSQEAGEPGEDLKLKMAAHASEETADWGDAERAYRRAAELAETEGDDASTFKAHLDLSRLYSLLDRHDESLSAARDAVISARRTEMAPILTMALESYGSELLHHGNVDAASAAAEEILALVGDEKLYALSRARALVLRSRCSLARGRDDDAARDLDAALPAIRPFEQSLLVAGYQSALSRWWQTHATLRTRHGDPAGAAEAMRIAARHARNVASAPQLEGPYKHNGLARTLHRMALALLANGDTQEAQAAFRESRAIRESIGLPTLG